MSAQGYLPRDLYKLDSAYGSEGELRECLRALRDANLKAIADIVINHRCAHFQVLCCRHFLDPCHPTTCRWTGTHPFSKTSSYIA